MSSETTFKVVFSGSIIEGHTKDQVTNKFRKAFKITDDKTLRHLFSGRLITLKSGLHYDKAKDYSEILRQLGADSCVEQESFSGFGAEEIDPEYARNKRRKVAQFKPNDLSDVKIKPKS